MTHSSRRLLTRSAIIVAAFVLLIAPVVATSGVWQWTDRSSLLSYRDGASITMLSERQGAWLASDGTRLYRFDGTSLQDLTSKARNHGLPGISNIWSDGRNWLVSYQPADRAEATLWLTDGDAWLDMTGKFTSLGGGMDASGSNGMWYVRNYTKAGTTDPSMFELSTWDGSSAAPVRVNMPQTISNVKNGCFTYPTKSTLCTGANSIVSVNGVAYYIGGSSEARGTNGVATQTAKGGIWSVQNGTFTALPNMPAFKFVSGVWSGKGSVLVATSNATTNPFAADHFWLFDGTNFRDVSSAALGMGLLSMDVREVRAASNGQSWMILSGKKLIRFDGVSMTDEGKTKDLFQVISSNGSGLFVLGGADSEAYTEFATAPLTAHFATVTEDTSLISIPAVKVVVSDVLSKIYGPSVAVNGDPTIARIGNGKTYVFRAKASDTDGVDHVDIYVNGGRVKTCASDSCEYAQTYWTNGTASRTVEMFARGVDVKGYANDSDRVTLTIDSNSSAGSNWAAPVTPSATPDRVPAGQVWTQDATSGIRSTSWTEPTDGTLASNKTLLFAVAASDADGLSKIDLWVNGTVERSCALGASKATNICSITLSGANYPVGTEIFVNANVFDAKSKSTWTTGTRVQRTATVVEPTKVTQTVVPVIGPVFTAVVTIKPTSATAPRGSQVQVHAVAQNNTLGLARVEVYANGAVQRTCSYGAAVSPMSCDITLDTTKFSQGATVTVMARAENNNGHEVWSNSRSIEIVEATKIPTNIPVTVPGGMNAWSWLSPAVGELSEGQTATYSVGAWSPAGIKKIEIVVDGAVRSLCAPATSGSQDCSFALRTSDYSHGHVATVNARVTDQNGAVTWTDSRSITIKREWTPVADPGAYVQITADRTAYNAGDAIKITARAWSPTGVDRIEVYANGTKVATCGSESCAWTSPAYAYPTFEFQARLTDRMGQTTWTGVQGLYRK